LGGIWTKLESQLRINEGETYDFEVNLTQGCMNVGLPDGAELAICKVPDAGELLVRSKAMQDVCGGVDVVSEASFK
jgi:hypothetical protein